MGVIEPSFTPSVGGATKPQEDTRHKKTKNIVKYPLWFGGSASCMAVCLTHPLDLGTTSDLALSEIVANTRSS
jgi:hypothetical protein